MSRLQIDRRRGIGSTMISTRPISTTGRRNTKDFGPLSVKSNVETSADRLDMYQAIQEASRISIQSVGAVAYQT